MNEIQKLNPVYNKWYMDDGGIIGEATLDFISQFRLDFGILGISGIDSDGSLLEYTPDVAMAADGRFVLAWKEGDMQAAFYSATGALQGRLTFPTRDLCPGGGYGAHVALNPATGGAYNLVVKGSPKAGGNVLQKTYPDHGFLGEESGLIEGRKEGADWLWIIDPLDGTTNFIHGFPQFAVSIAVQYKGVTEHGVVLDPIKREEFTASRGRGAAMNGRRLRVTARKSLEGGLLGTGFPFRPDQHANMDNYLGMFRDVAKQTAGLRRAGAASLDLAYVAAGRLDGFFEFGLQPWDVAAGDLLVREAGGLVSDFTGGHHYLTSGNVVAGNPKLLKSLLTTLAPHLNDSLRK